MTVTRRSWFRRKIVLYPLCALALWEMLGCALMRTVVFPRRFANLHLDAERVPGGGIEGLERWWIDTEQGKVEAWFVPGEGVTAERPGPAVVFAHGNGELIDDQPELIDGFRRMGVSVLLPEYRGYGRSAGSPSQKAITADYVRFHDQLTTRPEVDAKRVVYYGRSLGGGVVCSLAAHRKPAAIILQSTFRSVTNMAGRYLIPPFLVADPFDNMAFVKGYDGPVLIFHGSRDTIIAAHHGRALHKASPRSTYHEYDCDHNDFPVGGSRHWGDVRRFLEAEGLIEP